MDSLTQIVLGASVGELILGKQVGRRAALWGGMIGTLPDLDVVSRVFTGELEYLVAHRGVTHSLLFCVVAAPIMGWLIHRLYRERWATTRGWTWLAFWCLLTHTLLDCFTSWGTQLFYPISDYRVAWSTISVIDPLYTIPFMGCLIVALSLKNENGWRRFWNKAGLVISSCYLLLTITNKFVVNAVMANELHRQGKSVMAYETYPSMFNNALWYGVAREPSGINIGYYSLFNTDNQVSFTYMPVRYRLSSEEENSYVGDRMKWLSKGYFRVEERGGKKYWQDLRFGLKDFWEESPIPEVPLFEYEMIYKGDSLVDIHQISPNMNELGGVSFSKLWDRMLHNPTRQSQP